MQREKTIKSLADSLHSIFDDVIADKMDIKKARALTTVAGTIIAASRVRLQYKSSLLIGNVSKITELE